MEGCQRCHHQHDCRLVGNLVPESLVEVRKRARTEELARGDLLFREGEEPAGVWIVCHGSIKTYRHAPDGRPLIHRIATHGEFVGYRSFFLKRPYEGCGAAMEPSLVRYFDREAVEQLVYSAGSFAGLVLKQLALDLGQAETKATQMAYGTARRRVMDVLAELYRTRAGEGPSDDLVLRRQDLAEIAGMAVETTVRVLKELERDGVLAIRGRHIQVTAPMRLAAEEN